MLWVNTYDVYDACYVGGLTAAAGDSTSLSTFVVQSMAVLCCGLLEIGVGCKAR
jgi:hypothetical protein